MLICDVLGKNPVLQYVPLPTPVIHNVSGLGSPKTVRDIVSVKVTVRYFVMNIKVMLDTKAVFGYQIQNSKKNFRHLYGNLNLDEIKNALRLLSVNGETNLMNLIRL